MLATRSPLLLVIMLLVTNLGDPYLLFAIGIVVILTGWPTGRLADRLGPLAMLFLSVLVNLGLKAFFLRPRPGLEFAPLEQDPFCSFPSGHAMWALCIYGFLCYLSTYRPMAPWRRRLLCGSLWGLVLLVGLSRVYLAAHYPSDVVGGFAAGVPILWLGIVLHRAAGGAFVPAR